MKVLGFVLALGVLLLSNCVHTTGSGQKLEGILYQDRVFIESILTSLKSMTGEFELEDCPLVHTEKEFTPTDVDGFRGDRAFFARLEDVMRRYPSVTHTVISTLIGSLDDMTPTKVTYCGKAVPLGVMCYKALDGICYYEAMDKDGNIAAWEGTVFPGATEADLKIAKKAWKKILKEKAYIML